MLVRSSVRLTTPPLPFRGISVRVEDGKYDDESALDSEVDGVRKAPEQRPADSQPEILILERAFDNPIESRAQLFEELQP